MPLIFPRCGKNGPKLFHCVEKWGQSCSIAWKKIGDFSTMWKTIEPTAPAPPQDSGGVRVQRSVKTAEPTAPASARPATIRQEIQQPAGGCNPGLQRHGCCCSRGRWPRGFFPGTGTAARRRRGQGSEFRGQMKPAANSPGLTEAGYNKAGNPTARRRYNGGLQEDQQSGAARRRVYKEAVPSLVRCAQHLHAEDFLRILAGLLRQNLQEILLTKPTLNPNPRAKPTVKITSQQPRPHRGRLQ